MMKSNPRKVIGITAVLGVSLLLVLYITFQAKNLILGPQITITTPYDGETVPFHLVEVTGVAKNISSITLNDFPIFVDTQGAFSEKLIVEPGYSIIKLSAQDRFGRHITKLLRVVYNKETESLTPLPTSEVVATTTPPTATSSELTQ